MKTDWMNSTNKASLHFAFNEESFMLTYNNTLKYQNNENICTF